MTIHQRYLSADEVKSQIARLLTECPELREDDEALVLSLESETEATELCDRMVQNIEAMDAWVEALKGRRAKLKERISYLEFRQERMKQLLISIMQSAELKSLPLPSGTPAIRYSRHVVVTEKELVPTEYRRQPPLPDWEVDKPAVTAAIKKGENVPGCQLSNFEPSLSIKTC